MSYKPLKPAKKHSYMWESFNQLKAVGIFEVVVMILLLFQMVNINYSNYTKVERYMTHQRYDDIYETIFDPVYASTQLTGIIFTTVVCFSVLMLMLSFSFLYSRKSSDFYYSVPVSRKQIFLSKVGAVWIWQMITVVLGIAGGLIATYTKYNLIKYNYVMLGKGFILILIAIIYLSGVVILAFSLSGNLFSGLTLMVMLLFYMRAVVDLIFSSFSNIPIVYSYDLSDYMFLGRNNIVVTYLTHIADVVEDNTLFITWKNLICSGIIGTLLFVLAFVAFQRRKSETTGKSFGYKWIRIAVRFLVYVALAMLLFVAYDITVVGFKIKMTYEHGWMEIIPYVALTVIAALVYEKLSTKKFHIKSVFLTVILAYISAIALLMGLTSVEKQFVDFAPKPEDVSEMDVYVESYQAFDIADALDLDGVWANNVAFKQKAQSKPECVKKICEVLERNIKEMYDNDFYHDKILHLNVIFYTKDKTEMRRMVYFTKDDLKEIQDYLTFEVESGEEF